MLSIFVFKNNASKKHNKEITENIKVKFRNFFTCKTYSLRYFAVSLCDSQPVAIDIETKRRLTKEQRLAILTFMFNEANY